MTFYITRELLPFLFLFTTLFFSSILAILVSLVVWGLCKKIVRTASRYVTARNAAIPASTVAEIRRTR